MADEKMPQTEEERLKIKAETDKIKLEIESIKSQLAQGDALSKQIELENEKLTAERDKVMAEARASQATARYAELETETRERAFREVMASNRYNHIIRFNEEVNDGTVDAVIERLNVWHVNDPGCDIELIFNSPGGSTVAGMELFDYLSELKQNGHKIITGARGIAASMASVLLQAGDVRWMGRTSTLLLHEGQSHISGRTGEVQDTQEWMKDVLNRFIEIYVARCDSAAHNGTAKKPLKRTDFVKNIITSRKEWFLNAQACLDGGLIDEIRG